MRGYEADLAFVHDAGFGDVARGGASLLAELMARRRMTRGFVVELGCGSGESSRLLTRAGHRVLGIDQSPSMIRIARKRAPRARFRVESFVEAQIPDCNAVTAFGEVLNYAFDERHSLRMLTTVIERVHAALYPGGIFVFDVAIPGRGAGRTWTTGRDWAVMAENEERRNVLTREIVTFRKVRGTWRRSEEVHRQLLFEPGGVASLLRRTGFTVRVLRSYGAQPLDRHVRGFVATKRVTRVRARVR